MTAPLPDLLACFAQGERSLPLPATLLLESADGVSLPLIAETVLRLLPRKRLVLRAIWNGRPVALKLFARAAHGDRHVQRERAGLQAIRAAGIGAPAILGECRTPDGTFVGLLYEWLADAPELGRLWPTFDVALKQHWLARLVETLARLHGHGAWQADIHLGNFLVGGSAPAAPLWLLDFGTVQTGPSPLARDRSLQNLAALAAQLPGADRDLIDVPAYLQARGWAADGAALDRYRRALNAAWRGRWHDYLDKSLRDCSLTAYQQNFHGVVAMRRAAQDDALIQLVADPEAALPDGALLKAGNTATVARVGDWVVKRYNIKNWRHALGRCWRPTRAEHSWRFAHRLEIAAIRTPKPLALIERRWGWLRGRAWLVCEAVAGDNLLHLGERGALPAPVLKSLRELLRGLQRERLSHGDFKATNFLVSGDEVVLIDLDAMQQHCFAASFRRAFARDLRRLQRNWAEGTPARVQIDALVTELSS